MGLVKIYNNQVCAPLQYTLILQLFVQNMAYRQLSDPSRNLLLSPSVSLLIGLQNCLKSISNDKPLKQIRNDIFSFVQRIGAEGEKYVIANLMESIEISQMKEKNSLSYRISLLSEIIKEYATYDNFMSYFPEIVIKVSKEGRINQCVSNIMNNLKIPLATQIAIALSLYLSDRNELISIGENELIQRLREYQNSDKSIKLPQRLLDELLFQINISPQLNNKLQTENKILLDAAEKLNKNSETKIYNYFRDEWQLFANQTPIIQKPPQIMLRKTDILRDLGPAVTQQMDTLKSIISQIGPLSQQDIFECIMMMAEEKSKTDSGLDRFVTDLMHASSANTGKKNLKGEQFKKLFTYDLSNKKVPIFWNIDNFLLYCTQNIQNIKWQNVFANFDRENLSFVSDEHFVGIMKIFDKIKKIAKKWTLSDSILFKKWSHPDSQAQFLYNLFSCKEPDCIFFNESQPKKSQNPKQAANSALRQIWGYLDLVSLLFQVSQLKKQKTRQLIDIPITRYPDLFIRTLSQIKPAKGQQMVNQIYSIVLPQFLQNDARSIEVIEYLWQSNKELLIKTINNLHRNGIKRNVQMDLDKIVETFKNIQGSLDEIIMSTDSTFSLSLALIAGKKQAINFQKWLCIKLDKNQAKFSREMITYLENNLFKQLRVATQPEQKQNILQQANLNIEVLNKIFCVFVQKLSKEHPSSKHGESFKKLHKECCQLFPEVAQGHISEQAEKQCEQQIKKIYKEQITINEAIQNLKKLKNSTKKEEKQRFANRITFLCIEMTYHHSYPEKQLMITADLFSALINANMIEKKIFQVFLHVIDQQYLKADNQKFLFALRVMEKIKGRLAHQTWFCEKLIDNELMMKKDPELVSSIIKSITPPTVLSIQKQRKIKEAIRIKNAPPEPVSRHIIIQPQVHHPHHEIYHLKTEIVDFDILTTFDRSKKIEFNERQPKLKLINTVCNTLSLTNVQEKAKELKKSLDNEKAIQLLAYNIVFKRLTITQNNGIQVFAKLLENIPRAQKPVMNITYKILQNWFSLSGKSVNDKKFTNFKNIGAWLGRMTIGKGLPVPIYKLNLKNILIRCLMENNRINFNVPVILKILQMVTKFPEIFRQQSPWLRRIYRTLIEILTNLKQENQAKNQIRAFFKSTKMDIDTFMSNEPSFLRDQVEFSISSLIQSINLSEELIKYSESLQINNIKGLIAKVIQISIHEIMETVINRTVKLAKTTTKHMIMKDFVMETNSAKVKQSSLNLVRELSAPLAQVTCRESLKTHMTKNLKQSFREYEIYKKIKPEEEEKLIQNILTQILEFGCTIIKQKVVKEAQSSIKQDHELVHGLEVREMLKKSGGSYVDQEYIKTIPAIVPKQLRASPTGLTNEQYEIYNELKKQKNKEATYKYQKESGPNDENILKLVEQKQSIEKIKKILLNEQVIPVEELLYKVHTSLLQENNDEIQMEYYLQICQIMKEVVSQNESWKNFKEVADLRSKETQRIIRKLVRDKYFQQSVLSQLSEEEERSIKLFETWLNASESEIQKYMESLAQTLGNNEGNIRQFFYYSLKYVVTKICEQNVEYQQTFDSNYIEQYLHLVVSFYRESKEGYGFYIEQVLDTIIESFTKFQPKYSYTNYQRPFFKIIVNLIEMICNQKYKFNKEKVNTFILTFGRLLQKVNPLIKPGFSFAWLQLLCNKHLIKYLLENQENWELYFNLLCSLFRFMKENISQQKLYSKQYGEVYQTFYEAVLKLTIIIIHDFSPFLSTFSLELCLLVDSRFIQLKNIINSALPHIPEEIPLKIDRREDLENLVQKVGYPKYYNLVFDKPKLNFYLDADPKDNTFKQKLAGQEELFIQIFVLYIGWLSQNNLTQPEALKRLTQIITNSKQDLKLKLINYAINLIQYPNHITLFFIDFAMHVIFKQKDQALKELMLSNIMTRMKGEVPIAWGLIYLVKEFVNLKKELQSINISQQLLDQL